MARLDFPDGLIADIGNGLNGRPFGCHNDDLIVVVIKCRANAIRIANDEGISVTDHSSHYIPPVKLFAGSAHQPLEVQVFKDQVVDLVIGVTVRFVPVE